MDLLDGYSSDSSQESGKGSSNDKEAIRSSGQSSLDAATKVVLPSAISTTPKYSTSNQGSSNTDTTASSLPHSQVSHRGKKLLKLQAVLPPHVWQRLTKSSQHDHSSDNDEDEEEDEDHTDTKVVARNSQPANGNLQLPETHRHRQTPSTSTSRASGPTISTSASTPLASLLQSLPKAKSSSTVLVSPGILGSMDSTLVTADRKGSQSIKESPPVDESILVPGPTRQDETSTRSTMDPDVSDGEPNENPPTTTKVTTTTTPRPRAIPIAPPRPTVPPGTRGGTAMTRTAAPTVRTLAPAPLPQQQPPPSQPLPPPQQAQSKKARRKQMEAMLRAGNVYNISSDIHLEGGGNTEFAQQQMASQAAAAAAAAASYQAHGVRVVPTSHYNVSTGTVATSTTISGKQRGKNQLNALLANAASLEASRLENPQSANPQSTYRNNAKRKYGW